jgi:hypothetical protein
MPPICIFLYHLFICISMMSMEINMFLGIPFSSPRKLYKSLSTKPADDCSYWNHDLWPQPKTKAFLSPAALGAAEFTGKSRNKVQGIRSQESGIRSQESGTCILKPET